MNGKPFSRSFQGRAGAVITLSILIPVLLSKCVGSQKTPEIYSEWPRVLLRITQLEESELELRPA